MISLWFFIGLKNTTVLIKWFFLITIIMFSITLILTCTYNISLALFFLYRIMFFSYKINTYLDFPFRWSWMRTHCSFLPDFPRTPWWQPVVRRIWISSQRDPLAFEKRVILCYYIILNNKSCMFRNKNNNGSRSGVVFGFLLRRTNTPIKRKNLFIFIHIH